MTDAVYRQKTLDYVGKIKAAGYDVEEVDLSMMQHSPAMVTLLCRQRISSNWRATMACYGHRATEVKTLVQAVVPCNEGFTTENKLI